MEPKTRLGEGHRVSALMSRLRSIGERLRGGARSVRDLIARVAHSRLALTTVGLIAVGFLLPVAAKAVGISSGPNSLVRRASDALIVAGIISLLLDRPAKAAISRSINRDFFWGLVNADAPPEHRAVLAELASRRTVASRVEWSIHVDFVDDTPDLICLRIKAETWGRTFEPKGHYPSDNASVLASSNGHKSRYLRFELRGEKGEPIIELGEDQLNEQTGIITPRSDGGIELNIAQALQHAQGSHELDHGESYHQTREVQVYRHKRGFFPMWSQITTCSTSLKVSGPAVANHRFTLTRLDKTAVTHLSPDMTGVAREEIGTLPPACGLLLSWGPHDKP